MSNAVAELATRFRLSDPKPTRCSACFCSPGPGVEFVDFDCAIDRGTFVAPDGAGAVLDSIDDLHLCLACVRQAAEVAKFVPELHTRQLQEIRRSHRECEGLRSYVATLEQAIQARPQGG